MPSVVMPCQVSKPSIMFVLIAIIACCCAAPGPPPCPLHHWKMWNTWHTYKRASLSVHHCIAHETLCQPTPLTRTPSENQKLMGSNGQTKKTAGAIKCAAMVANSQ